MTNEELLNLSKIDQEIVNILEQMIEDEEKITVRAVIRHHSTLKAPSSITRNKLRSLLIEEYSNKQQELEAWLKRVGKTSKEKLSKSLATKNLKIMELENKVDLLTASHVAMIRAVGELGGFSKWADFFKDYQSIRDELVKMGAMPNNIKKL